MIDYDPHNWIDHLCDLEGSLVREIAPRIAICVLWSAAVVACHTCIRPLHIPSTVHSLVGVALGLLLVFRTNASYDRFWEGRKAWGNIINESRNLARQCRVLLSPNQPNQEIYKRCIVWTIAFAHTAMYRLRDQPQAKLGAAELLVKPYLNEDQRKEVDASSHFPLMCSVQITKSLNEARESKIISDHLFVALDQNVQLLVDALGVCERIHRTPLPFAYVVHLRRALVFYCYTLPFSLVDPMGWITPIGILLVSYIFFGIEEIGVEIENPFGHDENDLPLERLCETIQKDLLSI